MSIADCEYFEGGFKCNTKQNQIKKDEKYQISAERGRKNNTKNFGNSIKIYFVNKNIKHDRARWFNI